MGNVLIERKQANRKESRVAFIAALIMERCRNEEGFPTRHSIKTHVAAIYAAEFVRLADVHSSPLRGGLQLRAFADAGIAARQP
jgi:hypothetical protein